MDIAGAHDWHCVGIRARPLVMQLLDVEDCHLAAAAIE